MSASWIAQPCGTEDLHLVTVTEVDGKDVGEPTTRCGLPIERGTWGVYENRGGVATCIECLENRK